MPSSDREPVVVVSPHLDDAVLSAGAFLAARPGSVIVTAFAGGPPHVDPLPSWDRLCGFDAGSDVISQRRAEDRAAAHVLGATVHHLDHWDEQYRSDGYGYSGPATAAALTRQLADELARLVDVLAPRTWVAPLGIRHVDHRIAAAACRRTAAATQRLEWLVYSELPYAHRFRRDTLAARLTVRRQGFRLGESITVESGAAADAKERAIACYASQLRPLQDGDRRGRGVAGPAEQVRRLRLARSVGGG